MAVLFLQHVTRGAVGNPSLASIVELGVPPSVCHLPPTRGMRGLSHAECRATLPLVIQTGGYLESAGRMEEVEPGISGKEKGEQVWWGTRVFFFFASSCSKVDDIVI